MSSSIYEIRIEGHLDSHWTEWFSGWQIYHDENFTTLLTGQVPDQPALYGILAKINGLNLTLISANRVKYSETNESGVNRIEESNQVRPTAKP